VTAILARCPLCSTDQQHGRFCTQCGARMPDAADPADPYAVTPTVHEQSLTDRLLQGPSTTGSPPTREYPPYVAPEQANPPHQQYYQPPVAGPPPPPIGSAGGRRRGWLIAGAAFLVVAALATTVVLVLQRSGGDGTAQDPTALPSSAQSAGPPTSALPSVTAESKASPPGRSVGAATSTATAPGSAPAGTTGPDPAISGTAAPSVPPSVLPLGGPRVDIPCADSYIVQVASELDPAAFERRVSALRAVGQLSADLKWTEANSSCAIFTSQVNVLVLYAGPFAAPFDACAARLASPPDAFIKGTTPETANTFVSCLCPATVDQVPAITAAGQQGVWVGALQRILGSALDLNVGSINADAASGNPGSWGVYTAETAEAVGQFQGANGLPVSKVVDTATWAALQSATC